MEKTKRYTLRLPVSLAKKYDLKRLKDNLKAQSHLMDLIKDYVSKTNPNRDNQQQTS